MVLTKKELVFIRLATIISDGVFAYDEPPKVFKTNYGLTHAQAYKMVEGLRFKVNVELSKKMSKPKINKWVKLQK